MERLAVDTITLRVTTISVFQGGNDYAEVQASPQLKRGAHVWTEHELYERALRVLPDISKNLYCSRCGEWYPDEDFPIENRRKSRRNRAYECKACRRAYDRWLYHEGRTAKSQQHKRRHVA